MKPNRVVLAMPVLPEDQLGCPSWCEREHLGEGADSHGFHHDGAVTTIELTTAVVPGHPVDLFVNASLHAQRDQPGEPSLVELQDEHQTFCLLTPVECLALARALLAAAAEITAEDERVATRVEPLVRDLDETLASWRDTETG